MKKIQAIGLMSGTSLDGLDVCCVTFEKADKWNYNIDAVANYSYDDDLKSKLGTEAQQMSALEFVAFHSEYGFFLGQCVKDFMMKKHLHPDIIASHGHTIFHEPDKKIMCQIGDGAAIRAVTGVPVVCDFRRLDIMLGGQGAPLVPIGDKLLFSDYDCCLNIGGFSNISFDYEERRIAFDISPVNYVLNHYCREVGLEYDKDGDMARSGNIIEPLLHALNELDYYRLQPPKSLGREWVEKLVFPLLDNPEIELKDKLRTFVEHAAYQVSIITKKYLKFSGCKMLVTGGGAYNKFLMERIGKLTQCDIVIPDRNTLEYKEAIIFAFLGTLYMMDEPNCLSSVTGASEDNVGGVLFK